MLIDKFSQLVDVIFLREDELAFVPHGYQQLDKRFVWAGYDTSSGGLFGQVDLFLYFLWEFRGSDFDT